MTWRVARTPFWRVYVNWRICASSERDSAESCPVALRVSVEQSAVDPADTATAVESTLGAGTTFRVCLPLR